MFTNVTLLFVVLLFPMAGFIAWAGDRIGHRTGKKRHTLLGLRPRHTATLFTIGSGVLIVAVSFGAFWLSSESFRMVVQRGEELYRNNLNLKESIQHSRIEVQNIRSQSEQFKAERQKAEQAKDEALTGLTDAKVQRMEAESRATLAQQNYQQSAQRLGQAQEELRSARANLRSIQGLLDEKTQRIHRAERQITAVEERRRAAEDKVKVAERRQKEAEKEASQALKTAAQLVTAAYNQKQQLEKDLTSQKKQYADLQQKTDAQRQELFSLNQELETKRQEYAQVVTAFEQVKESTVALRGKQITYQIGEEVARISIRSGYNVWRIEAILEAFLTTAAKKAEERGAAKGREQRAVLIPPVPVTRRTATNGPSAPTEIDWVTEADALKVAAGSIRRANEDIVVLALAQSNAVAGEPVAIKLEIYRNPVVLTENTKLAEKTVNGEGSRQEVADAIYNFLNRDVHRRLVEAGMIPMAKGGDSSTTGTDVPRLEEFTLSGEEWLELMDQVRRSGPRAKIVAYAARNLRAGDPVALRFDVKGRPTQPLPMQTALDRWP